MPAGGVELEGELVAPGPGRGVVAFAHGSGSSRFSPRNRRVAEALQARGLGTLLVDLLTPEEEREDLVTGRLRFDIAVLAERVTGLVDWLGGLGAGVGLFGASTGAAAALIAAARRPAEVRAVVSRGGRPDLAREALAEVRAPTLLVVGARDVPVLELNREALERLRCPARLEVVPGAGHLFEEPGALDEVARLAGDWFERHLAR